jgi:hypothetical protein
MPAVLEVQALARKDVQVKLDADVVRMAKMVAAARDITLAEYLSEMIRPIVRRDLEKDAPRVLGQGTPPDSKKGGPK